MLFLCCIPSSVADETEEVEFESELAGDIDRTASEWMDTGSDRALLTVLLAVEASIDKQFGDADVLNILLNETYICKDGLSVCISGYTDSYIYLFIYVPATKKTSLTRMENPFSSSAGSVIKIAMEESATSEVYQNDDKEILKWIKLVAEAVSEAGG